MDFTVSMPYNRTMHLRGAERPWDSVPQLWIVGESLGEQEWKRVSHEFHETFMEKKTPNGAVTPQRQSQFTPKMKANAVPRLLSSLV